MLRMILGYRANGIVDDFLPIAVREGNVAILVDDRGPIIARLIDTVHRLSGRRAASLRAARDLPRALEEQRILIEESRGGTFALVLDRDAYAVDGLAREMLFDRDRDVRVIIAAPSTDVAVRVIGAQAFAGASVVSVPSLSSRSEDLEMLIDACFEQHQSPSRMADLMRTNASALLNHPWIDLSEIWETTRWLHAVATTGSIRKAAIALGVPRTTLQGWITAVGVKVPLFG